MRHPQSPMASLGWSCPTQWGRWAPDCHSPQYPLLPRARYQSSLLSLALLSFQEESRGKLNISCNRSQRRTDSKALLHPAHSVHLCELLSPCQSGCLWCLMYRMKPKFCGPASRPFQILSSPALRFSSLYFRLQLCSCTKKLWTFIYAVPSSRIAVLTCHPFAQLILTQPLGLIPDVSTSRKLSLTVQSQASFLCAPLAPGTCPLTAFITRCFIASLFACLPNQTVASQVQGQ